MKQIFRFYWLITGLLLISNAALAQKFSSENLFYLVNNLSSIKSFEEHANEISIVVPATYEIDQYGVITGDVNQAVMKAARDNHVKVMPIFGIANQKAIHEFLTDTASVNRAIRMLVYLAKRNHFYGWQLDFEDIHVTDGNAYTRFYKKAAMALHQNGFKISMAVVKSDQPVPDAGTTPYNRYIYENWRGAFNLKAIAKIGDFMSFMSYDEHTAETPPGPVSGIPWMEKMAKYLISLGISPQKISFGIPTYSDHWYPTYSTKRGGHSTCDEISYQRAENLIHQHDAQVKWMSDQGVDYTRWTGANGVFNWLFLENARSFQDKLKLIPKYHFRGFSVWVLGDEDPGIWKIIDRYTKRKIIQ